MSIYEFQGFRLLSDQRCLLARGHSVKLGSRAFDLLTVLVEGRDRVLTKGELLDRVWPGLEVEEANLSVQVLALRKVLGVQTITTVPGRGYQFTAQVQVVRSASGLATGSDMDAQAGPLAARAGQPPLRIEPLVGRERETQQLFALVESHRLVTLLGTGGVGKTRLAEQVVQRLQGRYAGATWWVELASLAVPDLVAATVARVLRTSPGPDRDAVSAVATTLRDASALLVLDNAEHVLGGVQQLVGNLLALAPQLHVLVTSQVALRLPGEQLMRLPPLSLPADDTLDAARSSGAVALFEARARRHDSGFSIEPDVRASVVDICRRLDGIPLAIEFAVARLPLLGLHGLRQRLDERFRVLTVNDHTREPRHRTLRAALDWSHDLLTDAEQRVLRRLATFAGSFTLESAQYVAADEQLDAWAVLDLLGSLVAKCLVVTEGLAAPRYRLLETIRLYALNQLIGAGERAACEARHGRSLADRLHVPPALAREDPRLWRMAPASPEDLLAELDNARAALDWAVGCPDDALVVQLAAGASHVFLAGSLNAEYLQRVLPLRERLHAGVADELAGLFWARLALVCSRNAHPAGLDAGLRAADIYRRIGDAGRLYDALTWCIAIASRVGADLDIQSLVDEAIRLEQADWPASARSSLQWARHRWLQQQGRPEEALACARAQAELLEMDGSWVAHVAWGANVADCELSLGRVEAGATRAAVALQALDALGIDENLVGHVLDTLMVGRTLQGQAEEARKVGRRARRLLEREGDELRLLDTLALNATTIDCWPEAARVAGHADAALAARGELRWPAAAQRRATVEQRLQAALGSALEEHKLAGASLSRDAAFALAFGDALPGADAVGR